MNTTISSIRAFVLAVVLVLWTTASSPPLENRPMIPLSPAAPQGASGERAGVGSPRKTTEQSNLTLEQAIEITQRLHPELAEARWRAEAAEQQSQQAGSFPNPELIGRIESAPFRGDTSSQADYLAGVSQTIPLSRRLSQARRIETLERDRWMTEVDARALQLRQRVQSAFATALYQQRAAITQAGLRDAAQQTIAIAAARLDAGDTVPEELARVEWEAARTQIEFRRSHSMREQALIALASAMGDPGLAITSVSGDLEAAFEIPLLESIALDLARHPTISAARADVMTHQARIDLARADRIPDVRVEALYRRMESTQQNAFDVGISVPLPLFERNQGRVRAARAELQAAEARSRSTAITVESQWRESYRQLADALDLIHVLRDEILPRANTVLRAWEARFEAGDVAFSELLAVRRDWANVQLDYLDAMREALQVWALLKPAQ